MVRSASAPEARSPSYLRAALDRVRRYWSLTKSLQTLLLLVTGIAGYASNGAGQVSLTTALALAGSLFLAISGSTVLNMWYDADIDAVMDRTCWRPLPSGLVHPNEALFLGLALSLAGFGWAVAIQPLFGAIVLAGILLDVVVYTIWLKRRTPWAILWGGLAGGMPVLAGRVLGAGRIEWVGLLLMMGVVLWIPTHILTFSIRHQEDYQLAGVPTFPSRYGQPATRKVIALSSLLAGTLIALSAFGLHMTQVSLAFVLALAAVLFVISTFCLVRPSARLNLGLFKYASLYMLGSMLVLLGQAL